MTREQVFAKIDNNEKFSKEYKSRLKENYDYFAENGYNMTTHALIRATSPKGGKNKREYTVEDVLEVLKSTITYIDGDTKYVHYYNGFSAIEAKDTGEIIGFVDNNYKPKKGWKKYHV